MTSIILRTAARYLMPLLLLFSVFVVLRGHNEPGGGFIGGLVAATAFTLYAMAYDAAAARRLLRIDLHVLLGMGLLLAAVSGMFMLMAGEPILTAGWLNLSPIGLGDWHLGTPLLFDLGVYLVVVSVALIVVLTMAEQ